MSARDFLTESETKLHELDLAARTWMECFDRLPAVDPVDGTSHCGFAKQIYAKSYEAEGYVRQARDSLTALLDEASAHIEETERELEDAQDDESVPEIRRQNLRIDLDRARRMVVTIRQRISSVRQDLSYADTKRYPGLKRSQ